MADSKPTRYIVRFETEDLGIDGPQYFQGFGTSHTNFDSSCVGIGDNPREALSDALESMAQSLPSGAFTPALERRIVAKFIGHAAPDAPTLDDVPDSPGALDEWREENEDEDGNPPEDSDDAPELRYHVGIRWTCEPDPLERMRDDEGKLPGYAWPGGYPIYYLMRDDDMPHDAPYVVCPTCANAPRTPECNPVASEAHYEGPPLECEECNGQIESAYGDPDAEPTEPSEDDVATGDHRRFYQYGKLVLSIGEDDDHVAALNAWMERKQFWPDAWFISDHGNAHRIDLG
jgi:hypothetical protein